MIYFKYSTDFSPNFQTMGAGASTGSGMSWRIKSIKSGNMHANVGRTGNWVLSQVIED